MEELDQDRLHAGIGIDRLELGVWLHVKSPYPKELSLGFRGYTAVLQDASIFDLSIEEKAEERADRSDRREAPQFVPRRLERGIDDVGRHLECEAGN